jgi:hypothetical protein
MFLVTDTLEGRQKKVRSFLDKEPVIAVLLAAADFEWTTRRAILALGKSPTKSINARFLEERRGGLKALAKYWKDEVQSRPKLRKELKCIVTNWDVFFNKAYPLRHKLVHGAQGTTGVGYATKAVEAFLAASKEITMFALDNHEPIYGRCIRRINPRQ